MARLFTRAYVAKTPERGRVQAVVWGDAIPIQAKVIRRDVSAVYGALSVLEQRYSENVLPEAPYRKEYLIEGNVVTTFNNPEEDSGKFPLILVTSERQEPSCLERELKLVD